MGNTINSKSVLDATNTQDAIDEIVIKKDFKNSKEPLFMRIKSWKTKSLKNKSARYNYVLNHSCKPLIFNSQFQPLIRII